MPKQKTPRHAPPMTPWEGIDKLSIDELAELHEAFVTAQAVFFFARQSHDATSAAYHVLDKEVRTLRLVPGPCGQRAREAATKRSARANRDACDVAAKIRGR